MKLPLKTSKKETAVNWKKYLLIAFFFVGAISMLVMSFHYFQSEISGIMKRKEIAQEAWYRYCLKTHILFGIVAIFLGPVQFVRRIRDRFRKTHKQIGYVYGASVFISSITGLVSAQYAMGGLISTLGFSALAIFWFISISLALKAILAGKVNVHQKWMFISYGLTFAAIPQRTLLLFPLFLDVDFIPVYRLSAWLPWILNTLIALYLFKQANRKINIQNHQASNSSPS